MIDFELQELNRETQWRLLLGAYDEEHRNCQSRDPEALAGNRFDGWIPRVDAVAGIELNAMSAMHGKLIAVGFLNFRLVDRTLGVLYQVTASGKQALEMQSAVGSRQ